MGVGRRSWRPIGVLVRAMAAIALVVTVGVVPASTAVAIDAPFIDAEQLGAGWTAGECVTEPTETCFYTHAAATLAVAAWPDITSPRVFVEAVTGMQCANGGERLDVGDLIYTGGCAAEDGAAGTFLLAFANEEWTFTATMITSGEQPFVPATFLLSVRREQLELAGGEPQPAADVKPSAVAAALDRYFPAEGPIGFVPPTGVTLDVDSFETLAEDDIVLPRSDLDFLSRRTTARIRIWTGSGDEIVAVLVTQYPYEVLAGLALDALQSAEGEPVETSAEEKIDNFLAVESVTDESPILNAGFRRGALEVRVIVAGADRATRAELASAMALAANEQLLRSGPTAALQPPSSLTSIAQSAVVTTMVGAAAVVVRRLLGGRARRASSVGDPAPVVADVSTAADALRRRGHTLAASQVVACVVIVIGLVADIGWWWIAVSGVGVLVGLAATLFARRLELEGALRYRFGTGVRSTAYGVAAVSLLVVGVAAAVRGLKEFVLFPSLSHLRLAERLAVSPWRLAGVMAVAGLAALIVGAVLLRRARAWSRGAASSRDDDPRPPILYLRSFDDDGLAVPSVHSARRPFLELFNLRGRDPFEEGIAWELAANGPVLAIGRPDRSTTGLGAVRQLLDPATWQDAVAGRMREAAAIMLAIGETPGLAWEVGEIIRAGHLGKTVFVVPPAAPADVSRRWTVTCQAIDHAAGRLFVPPVNVAGALTARIDPTGGNVRVTWADRLDEASYRAAVDHEFAAGSGSAATARR